MDRPLSQLIHFPLQTGDGAKTLMTLHGYNAFGDSIRELGFAANPGGRVLGLQASKGVYLGRDIVGYTWFVGPLQQPSPVHYGDALQELERFFLDQIDGQEGDNAELPFLLGIEQGATMALAMAAATPDLISGVIAIDAIFPTVPGWEPPLAPLNGLPILLARNPIEVTFPEHVLVGDRIAETFTAWGAIVSQTDEAGGELSVWLSNQPVRYYDRSALSE
jgi:pimeloyl-ACP methyl ester carboxylesterase